MRGGIAIARVYSDLIVAQTPAIATRLDAENGATSTRSTPALVAPGQRAADQIRLSDWPFVLVVPQRIESIVPDGLSGDGSATYRVSYRLRIFAWARGDGFIETDEARHRLTLALIETLLSYPQPEPDVRTDPTTLVADYSDVVADEALASTIAASSIDVTITSHEILTNAMAAYDVATTEVTTVDTLPRD